MNVHYEYAGQQDWARFDEGAMVWFGTLHVPAVGDKVVNPTNGIGYIVKDRVWYPPDERVRVLLIVPADIE